MTPRAALVRRVVCLGSLAFVASGPARAQVVRVTAGDRELARAEVSRARGYPALPITLLARLGGVVTTDRDAVEVRLFDDTLRFYPGYAQFQVNGRMETLHAWTYQQDGVLYVAQWFFTSWLSGRYPERIAYWDGALRLAAGKVPPAGPPSAAAAGAARQREGTPATAAPEVVATKRAAGAKDTAGAAAAATGDSADAPTPPHPGDEQLPLPHQQPGRDDPLRGVLLGFIDARVSGVFDSNVEHDLVPRPAFGTVARLGTGIQSARARPFLTARYDFALYRFAEVETWNRTTHDVSAELAPSFSIIRLRLGAAVRLGSWTEDRQPADQIILRPRIEIRPTPIHVLSLYVQHSARRIDLGTQTQSDTFRLAGVGYYRWWHGGGMLVDGRYEENASEYAGSRYTGWTAYGWMRVPLVASHRLTIEAAYNRRQYGRSFVDPAGSVVRQDRRLMSAVAFTSEFAGARWELGLEYEFQDNASNDAYARFEAHRVEFTVRRRW